MPMSRLECFVVMPFGDELDPVFETVRDSTKRAVPDQEIHCYWLKDVHAAGRITDDIVTSLQRAALCIADVTGCNPNVMWETGYAMALGKPTILVGQAIDQLPFDLKVHRVLEYSPSDLTSLGQRLGEAVRQTMARYELETTSTGQDLQSPVAWTVAVTGTMRADPARAAHRIETLLAPYTGAGTLWYCGSNGTVDETVLEYLVSSGERATAVGYHRYDVSERVRELVKEGQIAFLDGSTVQLPRGLQGPSERDVFFCTRADLVVLLWDGESQGTGVLVDYFERNGKNVLIGFL